MKNQKDKSDGSVRQEKRWHQITATIVAGVNKDDEGDEQQQRWKRVMMVSIEGGVNTGRGDGEKS
ncbi:hypothetical protein U1Q18_044055 [Sarracenia purpurea var. burkii]